MQPFWLAIQFLVAKTEKGHFAKARRVRPALCWCQEFFLIEDTGLELGEQLGDSFTLPLGDVADAAVAAEVVDTGLTAMRGFMLAAHPQLRKNGGSVIIFGSGAGLEGQPTQAAYGGAKEAIRGFSRVAANEWASEAIRVNVVCPIGLTGGVAHWRDNFLDFLDLYDDGPIRRFLPMSR